MKGPLTQVVCKQQDCCYYEILQDAPGKVFCSHGEKMHYMDRSPCPLYRMDWQKKGGAVMDPANAQQFLKMVKRPGR